MATIAEMLVKLGMDISGFKAGTDGAKKELSGLEKSMKGLESAGKAMTSIGTSISIGVTAPLMTASTALASFTVQAESMVKVRDAFDNIATAAGSSGDAILEAMRKSSQGMVSNIDMMKSFNLAAQLVSEDFALKLPEAMGYLGKVAAATGTSMDYLLDSLVRGVGRLSPLILDNLGIQVDMNAAYEKYAGVLGKSVDEMSKAEKQTALMNETMKLLEENTASMPDNYGNVTQALKATFQNAKDAIGETLLPVLGQVAESLTKTINKIVEMTTEGGNLYPAIQSMGEAFTNLVEKIGDVVDWFGQLDPAIASTIASFGMFLAAMGPILLVGGKLVGVISAIMKVASSDAIYLLAGKLGVLGTTAAATLAPLLGIAAAFAAVTAAAVYTDKKTKEFVTGLENTRAAALEGRQSFDEYAQSVGGFGSYLNRGGDSILEYNAKMNDARAGLVKMYEAGKINETQLKDMTRAVVWSKTGLEDAARAYYDFNLEQVKAADFSSQMAAGYQAMNDYTKNHTAAVEEETAAIAEQTAAIATEAEGIKSIGANFSGMITYAQQYDSIQKQINEKLELMAQIDVNGDGIADVGNKANGTQTDLEALKGEVEALQGSLETMAAQATLNMLQASIAIGGVTEAESKLFFDTAVAMGQMTREGADAAYKSYSDSIRLMNLLELDPKTGEISVDNYDAMMAIMAIEDMTISEKIAAIEAILSGEEAVEASLDNLARDRVSTVTVRTVNTGGGGGGNTPMLRAGGGDVIGGMPYIVGERGPELFVPNINGEIIPNHELSDYATGNVINNYNLTMPTTARAEDIRMAFELMEAWNR